MRTTRIDQIEGIPVVDWTITWRPVRRTLGIEAFGINAYTAGAGQQVVEEHDELGSGAGHHEELYVVVSGHATFTVEGEEVDAPPGTLVFLDDPAEKRAARALEEGTTVLAIGGRRGEPFTVSPWEFFFAAGPAWARQDWAEAERLHREGLELHPGNPDLLYNLACVLALKGDSEEAITLLEQSFAADAKFRDYAREDSDLESLRADERFLKALEHRPA